MSSIYSAEYQKLIELLVAARKRAGITQQELAEKLGRPQSFVSKVERGERRLDVAEFLHLSELLRIDPRQVLDRMKNRK